MEGNQVWSAQQVSRIFVGENEKQVSGEITAETVKQTAADHGVRKFTVKDSNGTVLTPDEFPTTRDVYVQEYNEAK